MKSRYVFTTFRVLALVMVSLVPLVFSTGVSFAKSAQEIDQDANAAIRQFEQETRNGQELINRAAGVLIFPGVTKAGLGVGGEYGDGALRVSGKTVDYYNISAASVGLQAGAEKRNVLIAFMDPSELEKFRQGSGFKVGTDMSVAVAKMSAGGAIDTQTMRQPIVGFIYGERGLMGNLTLEGSKITKINK